MTPPEPTTADFLEARRLVDLMYRQARFPDQDELRVRVREWLAEHPEEGVEEEVEWDRDPERIRRITDAARQHDCTPNALIEIAVKEYIERHTSEGQAA